MTAKVPSCDRESPTMRPPTSHDMTARVPVAGRQCGVKTIASKDASLAEERGAFIAPLDGPCGLVCNSTDGGTQFVTKAQLAPLGLSGFMTAGMRAAVLPCHVGRQHAMEGPDGAPAEAHDTIEHGERVVLLGLVTEHARHLCPFIVHGDGASIVQRAPLAHLDLLGVVAG